MCTVGYETSVMEMYEPSFDANVSRVTIDMTIRRKPSYYAFNFLAPCIILHILSIGIFIIPRDKEEKVEFGKQFGNTLCCHSLIAIHGTERKHFIFERKSMQR